MSTSIWKSFRTRLAFGFRNPYGTHSVFLESTLSFLREKGIKQKVLFEIGTGGKSSEIFQNFLNKNPDYKLISFEHDFSWVEKYRQSFPEGDNFRIVHVPTVEDWNQSIAFELSKVGPNNIALAFIDSSPWESRSTALSLLKDEAQIVLVHDVDYFPHHDLFGVENSPILKRPRNAFWYGRLLKENLGSRNYDDIFKVWIEVFPSKPAWFTGPPTLIGSNQLNVEDVSLPRNSIFFSE